MAGDRTSLARDFVDLLRAFIDHEVRFLIVGAYALAVHGRPRATGDLDVWIDATPENARRAMNALRVFGAPLTELRESDLSTPGVVFQIGVEPLRIDILTSISGVTFAEAWPARVIAPFDGIEVPAIGRDHFLANKRATARPQDLVDLRKLERRSRE
jgi:predicted nucleotidyltransferase